MSKKIIKKGKRKTWDGEEEYYIENDRFSFARTVAKSTGKTVVVGTLLTAAYLVSKELLSALDNLD